MWFISEWVRGSSAYTEDDLEDLAEEACVAYYGIQVSWDDVTTGGKERWRNVVQRILGDKEINTSRSRR